MPLIQATIVLPHWSLWDGLDQQTHLALTWWLLFSVGSFPWLDLVFGHGVAFCAPLLQIGTHPAIRWTINEFGLRPQPMGQDNAF